MAGSLWFDVTTLWFSKGSPPDGVPRTMISYAIELMKRARDIRFCRYDRGEFIILSAKEMETLIQVFNKTGSTKHDNHSEEPESFTQRSKSVLGIIFHKSPKDVSPHLKTMARAAVNIGKCFLQPTGNTPKGPSISSRADDKQMHTREPFPFRRGDVLLIMGFLWILLPYERFAKEIPLVGYQVVTVIYDLIPVIFPELFNNLIQDRHLECVLRGSSLIFAISEHTTCDISSFAARQGTLCPRVYRIHLGNNPFRPAPKERPRRFESLTPGKFVLYVSTLAYRKNHELLYGIWRDLYETNQAVLIPLVLVGGTGPMSESFLELLHRTQRLYPEYIKHFTDVNDSQLAWLYTHCRFTVFPSFYEGWGLPVCEAMGYGKTCISSDTTSLVEAGSGLTELIRPFDYYVWKEKIFSYITDDTLLKEKEDAVRAGYRPITWQESVERFVASMNREYPGIFNDI
jgi:glycosyltransferase involved in cell wall biosynthesis